MENIEVVDYIKKSFELKEQGFYKPAIEMLYKALSLDGDNLEILAQLAHLYYLLNNFERTINYVEKVLEVEPKHLDCLFLLEHVYLKRENLKSALEIAEKIYEIQHSGENLANKINILNKLGDIDAIKEISESLDEQDDSVLYEIACAYKNNNDITKAIELLEKGYEINKKNPNIVLSLAKIYYEKGDYQKSQELFEELEDFNPTAEVLNYLGLFKLNNNDYTKAVNYFSAAEEKDSKNPEYAFNLASAHFLNGWFDEALKYFNRAICLEPDNVAYHYSIAYLYYQKKLYEKAMQELDFVKDKAKGYEPANVLNAMILAKKGDLLGAKLQLEEIVKFNNEDDFAISALSEIYKELQMGEKARDAIKRAIELKPNSLEYLSNLVSLEISQKNYDEAKELAEKILQLNDKYIYGYIAIAKIYFELRDFENLYDYAQDIINLDSNNPEGYYYNSIALFEQGDRTFALESLKKSISLDLYNPALYIKMSEFYQETGDFKNAYEWAKEASGIDERNYKNKWLCAKLAATLHNEDDAVKYYSQSYRLASFDNDLCKDYAAYLNSIGREKQAKKILK